MSIAGSAVAGGTVGDCTFYGGGPNDTHAVAYSSWDVGEFDPTVPNGAILFKTSFGSLVYQNGVGSVECKSSLGNVVYTGIGPVGQYNTYPTGVSGVGVRLVNTLRWNGPSGGWSEVSYPYRYNETYQRVPLYGIQNTTIELVKTGPITAQGEITGLIAQHVAESRSLVLAQLFVSGSIKIKPRVPTCSVQTKSINVSMNATNVKSFTGVGSTSADKPFDIKLNCSNGTSGATTRMFMTMTDVANPGNRSTTLSLSKGSTATGVGYQIVRQSSGSLVSYGPDSSSLGNPGQWFVGQYGNQGVSIPLVARYVQTQQNMTVGTANAVATFTMSYQ
ncbi:type 1 fimbrial protein [Burkholderia sp. Ac-20344]|nr:fimbrial protein [Burkholderia sp. Ac-20344]MBN3830515.1 type 1 fimbrial protein [Burkholderia sp. Ac-20344]RQV53145.1 type 1 fimbrial protein [Burkholderia cenocepacia]